MSVEKISDSNTQQEYLPEKPGRKTKYPILVFLLFFVLFVFVTALTLTVWNQRDRSNSNITKLHEFSGNGNSETEFFDVKNPWEIRWEHQGRIMAIEWIGKEVKGEALVEMHKKPIRNHGSRQIGKQGEFKLKISAEGPWKMEIWQFRN